MSEQIDNNYLNTTKVILYLLFALILIIINIIAIVGGIYGFYLLVSNKSFCDCPKV